MEWSCDLKTLMKGNGFSFIIKLFICSFGVDSLGMITRPDLPTTHVIPHSIIGTIALLSNNKISTKNLIFFNNKKTLSSDDI